MKRGMIVACLLLVLFGSVIATWGNCQRVSLNFQDQHRSSGTTHAHKHHADGDHHHSHDAVIHCPVLDEFIPVATFSLRKEHRVDRLGGMLSTALNSPLAAAGSDRLIHGPPGFEHSSRISPYLLLSVLRI